MSSLTTAQAFDSFAENLKLDPLERAAAEKVHTEITDLLIEYEVISGAFLQGSFARKTMIAPLRDIDKVVILHPKLADHTPDEAMSDIQNTIAMKYPEATFERKRHSIMVDFGESNFSFDIVPAWGTSTDDVLIANRDSGTWDRSNTRELIRIVAERNQVTNGRFIHQVRMLKQAVKNLLDGIIPGLHIESWAYIGISESLAHDVAVTRIFEIGSRLLGESYTEPTGKDKISSRLKPDIIAKAKPVFADAAYKARQALALTESGDHNEAIRIWHGLFGDCFPVPNSQDDATALRRSFEGGAITSVGTVTTNKNVGQTSKPVRSWRNL
jgi:hypothetical protein